MAEDVRKQFETLLDVRILSDSTEDYRLGIWRQKIS